MAGGGIGEAMLLGAAGGGITRRIASPKLLMRCDFPVEPGVSVHSPGGQ